MKKVFLLLVSTFSTISPMCRIQQWKDQRDDHTVYLLETVHFQNQRDQQQRQEILEQAQKLDASVITEDPEHERVTAHLLQQTGSADPSPEFLKQLEQFRAPPQNFLTLFCKQHNIPCFNVEFRPKFDEVLTPQQFGDTNFSSAEATMKEIELYDDYEEQKAYYDKKLKSIKAMVKHDTRIITKLKELVSTQQERLDTITEKISLTSDERERLIKRIKQYYPIFKEEQQADDAQLICTGIPVPLAKLLDAKIGHCIHQEKKLHRTVLLVAGYTHTYHTAKLLKKSGYTLQQETGSPPRYDGTTFHPVANIPVHEAFDLFHRDEQRKRTVKKLLYTGGALVLGYLGYTLLSNYWKK